VSPEAAVATEPRLKVTYREDVAPAMLTEFGYSNPMQTPKPTKVVLNIGIGESLDDRNALDAALGDLTNIAGQKPVIQLAKKSISNFKLREGMQVGLTVTLRGQRMWDFLDRLINLTLPRVRDFHGISRRSFDGRGNYSLGFREQIAFPEIDYNSIDKLRGLQVTVVTSAGTDTEGLRMLEMLGMPFERVEEA
jgi:large subunit ribosomal protein L5